MKTSSNDTESTVLGWKFIVIVGIITIIFFSFLYLAMSSDPGYMPNREPKGAQKPTNTVEHSTTGSQHPTHNGGDSSQ